MEEVAWVVQRASVKGAQSDALGLQFNAFLNHVWHTRNSIIFNFLVYHDGLIELKVWEQEASFCWYSIQSAGAQNGEHYIGFGARNLQRRCWKRCNVGGGNLPQLNCYKL